MIETGMGTVVSVLEKLGVESMSIDIENQEVAFELNGNKYLYKVNVNVLSKKLWKTYYSAYWLLPIWQEPGFAVLIASTLILVGYLIGAFV